MRMWEPRDLGMRRSGNGISDLFGGESMGGWRRGSGSARDMFQCNSLMGRSGRDGMLRLGCLLYHGAICSLTGCHAMVLC
jgi:hypothetical protein